MLEAVIQLILKGESVTMEEAEQFANFIGYAISAAGASDPNKGISVGTITLKGETDGEHTDSR